MLSTKATARDVGRTLIGRTSIHGLSARRNVTSRVATPEVNLESLEAAERARLETTDAFAELMAINEAKQSVNRPQKVEELKFRQTPTFADCFPGSEKCYNTVEHEGYTMQVPFRRVHLTNGNHFDLYDTSGPQGINPREGLPKLRAAWVSARDAAGDTCQTQMYYARQGVVTPEMAYVAAREGMEPEFVRAEVMNSGSDHLCSLLLHFCLLTFLTPEMPYVATREGMELESGRSEVMDVDSALIKECSCSHQKYKSKIINNTNCSNTYSAAKI
eukprot:GHUV01011870.1.p1 GENE.GHUV01011870.1~~GHUV01011870.1.p1  ORF type:complete len:274 (+),score=21.87 GHUV01011870.1:173-994(+)